MAVRTTGQAVRDILTKDYDCINNPSLTGYIASASSIVDDVRAAAIVDENPYGFAKLELIERWLAAWFYTLSDPVYASRSTGGDSASFVRGKDNPYLEGAKAVDTGGYLEAFLDNRQATGFWLGTPDNEAISYDDRN